MATSKRLKNRSQNLVHWTENKLTKVSERVVEGFIQGLPITISLEVSAIGIVEKVSFSGQFLPETLAFFDILLDFCLGKDQKTLSGLEIREIENYCRDENHIPVIEDKDFLDQARKLLENVKNNVYNFSNPDSKFDFNPQDGAFKSLRLVEKIKILESLFDLKVRPVLLKDGGNLVLEEVEQGDKVTIIVKFEGNCGTCPSSESGTLDFIRQTVQENLFDRELQVSTVLKRYL